MIISLRQIAAKYSLEPMTRVLHVGGHYGEELQEYITEGAKQVALFEPSSTSFDEMAKRVVSMQSSGASQGVSIFCLRTALGNRCGHATLNVETANAGQSSSLLKAKVHATQYPGITFDSTEDVEICTLDQCGAIDAMRPFDFLAIDVQGYELEVFKGGVQTLKGIRAISAEINREELYEGCALVGEVDAFLAAQGFDRVETEWCGGTWGEGIYVRRRAAP
jgi:FkbM family methyltransferase